MRTIRWYHLTLLLLLTPRLDASTGPQILVNRVGSSMWVTSCNYWYQDAGVYHSIRDVDFRNLRIAFFYGEGRQGRPEPSALVPYQLKNGKFSKQYSDGAAEGVSLDDLQYFGRPNAPPERVLLSLRRRACGGSCSENGEVMVIELRNGRLIETQYITYDFKAPGAGVHFSPKKGILIVKGRYADNSPDCCPDKLQVTAFKWDGKAFQVRKVKVRRVKRTAHWKDKP